MSPLHLDFPNLCTLRVSGRAGFCCCCFSLFSSFIFKSELWINCWLLVPHPCRVTLSLAWSAASVPLSYRSSALVIYYICHSFQPKGRQFHSHHIFSKHYYAGLALRLCEYSSHSHWFDIDKSPAWSIAVSPKTSWLICWLIHNCLMRLFCLSIADT